MTNEPSKHHRPDFDGPWPEKERQEADEWITSVTLHEGNAGLTEISLMAPFGDDGGHARLPHLVAVRLMHRMRAVLFPSYQIAPPDEREIRYAWSCTSCSAGSALWDLTSDLDQAEEAMRAHWALFPAHVNIELHEVRVDTVDMAAGAKALEIGEEEL